MSRREALKGNVMIIAPLISNIKKYEIDVTRYLSECGLPENILESPDNKISLETYHELFIRGVFLTGDSFLGLHSGELFSVVPNILGYTMLNCPTPEESLKILSRYWNFVDATTKYVIDKDDKLFYTDVVIQDDEWDKDPNLTDYCMASFLSYLRTVTGVHICPIAAHFRHMAPENKGEYARIFNCKLTFGSPKNSLMMHLHDMETPNLNPNKDLLEFFNNHITEFYRPESEEETYSQKVQKYLFESIHGEIPQLVDVSKKLAMSPRNLQKQLAGENTTYSILLDQVRKEIAFKYIQENRLAIAEIAYLLGFSEPSAFHRSFKKWTNTTPKLWKKSNLAT